MSENNKMHFLEGRRWPSVCGRFAKQVDNTAKRGFTPEEIARMIARDEWKDWLKLQEALKKAGKGLK